MVRQAPLMGYVAQVSWKRALGVFDARLANVPLGYGAKLRRWKKIVAEVHSVFEAKLPEDCRKNPHEIISHYNPF